MTRGSKSSCAGAGGRRRRRGCGGARAAAARRRGGAAHLQRARHKVVVVRLVEEDVLAVARRLGGKVLQHAVRPDAVLQAQLPPELHADCGTGGGGGGGRSSRSSPRTAVRQGPAQAGGRARFDALWLPHWPTCSVMISRGILMRTDLREARGPGKWQLLQGVCTRARALREREFHRSFMSAEKKKKKNTCAQ